jgi:hypothetical protein
MSDDFASVLAAGDGEPSWAASSEPAAEPPEPEALALEDAAAVPALEWEPLPSQSLEERVLAMESFLGPRVDEWQRQEQLAQMQAMADVAHGMPAADLAAHAAAATERAITERLGLVPQPATLEDVVDQADTIAASHLDNWEELRAPVIEEMTKNPAWLHAVAGDPSPAAIASAYISVASALQTAAAAREQQRVMKEQAQTMSGGSSRPATQTADEQYWAAVRDAGRAGYGS